LAEEVDWKFASTHCKVVLTCLTRLTQ